MGVAAVMSAGTHHCQPGGGAGSVGSGRQFGGGRQPGGGTGQPGGGLKVHPGAAGVSNVGSKGVE